VDNVHRFLAISTSERAVIPIFCGYGVDNVDIDSSYPQMGEKFYQQNFEK
jgi:hypothetical protein